MPRVRGNPRLRLLDLGLGVPALLALGALPKRRRPTDLRRVGVLRTAAIGDTLLLRGVLQDLREQIPQGFLVLVTGTTNAEAGGLVASGLVEHLVIPERQPFAAIASLRALKLDAMLDTGAWPRLDAILTSLSGAAFRVGFRTRGQWRHFGYDETIPHSSIVHEVDNFRELFRTIGVDSRRRPSLADVNFPLPDHPGPYVVFHPWPGGYKSFNKEWPLERWVELGLELAAYGSVAVTGAGSDTVKSDALARMLRQKGVDAFSRAGQMSLRALAGFLRGAQAVVSVNTGVMHLAAMVGATTIALEGPTPPGRWGPIGPRAISVTSSYPGCGFLDLGFEYEGRRSDCMLGISVEDVAAAVRAQITSA